MQSMSKVGDLQPDAVQQEAHREQKPKRTIRRDITEPTNTTQGRGDASSATANAEMKGVSEEDNLPATHTAESSQVKPKEKRRHEKKKKRRKSNRKRRGED